MLTAAIFAGGMAAINEHVVKEQLQVPRPNIVWLAGENGSGPLGTAAKEFYEAGDKEARRKPLAKVLSQQLMPVPLSPSIEAHWIEETGYSFPSGYSFSAMFFATFFTVACCNLLDDEKALVVLRIAAVGFGCQLFTTCIGSSHTC